MIEDTSSKFSLFLNCSGKVVIKQPIAEIPKNAIDAIDHWQVRGYITESGWEKAEEISDKALIYKKKRSGLELILPIRKNLADYAECMAKALIVLSEEEKTSFEKTLQKFSLFRSIEPDYSEECKKDFIFIVNKNFKVLSRLLDNAFYIIANGRSKEMAVISTACTYPYKWRVEVQSVDSYTGDVKTLFVVANEYNLETAEEARCLKNKYIQTYLTSLPKEVLKRRDILGFFLSEKEADEFVALKKAEREGAE